MRLVRLRLLNLITEALAQALAPEPQFIRRYDVTLTFDLGERDPCRLVYSDYDIMLGKRLKRADVQAIADFAIKKAMTEGLTLGRTHYPPHRVRSVKKSDVVETAL